MPMWCRAYLGSSTSVRPLLYFIHCGIRSLRRQDATSSRMNVGVVKVANDDSFWSTQYHRPPRPRPIPDWPSGTGEVSARWPGRPGRRFIQPANQLAARRLTRQRLRRTMGRWPPKCLLNRGLRKTKLFWYVRGLFYALSPILTLILLSG